MTYELNAGKAFTESSYNPPLKLHFINVPSNKCFGYLVTSILMKDSKQPAAWQTSTVVYF